MPTTLTRYTNQDVLASLELSTDVMAEIAKNTSNAVIVTDLTGRILYVNEGFEKVTEYSSHEVLGMNPGKLLQGPETDPNTVQRIRSGIASFSRVNETILNYSKSDRRYWLQLDIFPVFDEDNNPLYFMAIESDVTELIEKERIAREQNERIQDNIAYAQLLQNALFRNQDQLSTLFEDHFVIDRPKDTVGGDFYLATEIQGKKVVLLGDCTGHGVSGAIMTALSIATIQEHLDLYKTLDPEMILTKSIEKLSEMLSGDELIRDSFEATLLFIDENKKTVRYASTNQCLYLFGQQVEKIMKKKRGVRSSPGDVGLKGTLSYLPGSVMYMCSDGLQDQFGGPDSKKFGTQRIRDILSAVHTQPCNAQKEAILSNLQDWQAAEDQTDDVLLLGLRLS